MKKILLIEDDVVMRTVYQRVLSSNGFEVEVAFDGEEGLAKLARVQPDAVVVDVMMPKLSGIGVVQAIRAQDALRALPVMVVTNAAVPAFVEQARAAGANHVCDKSKDSPVVMVALLRRLLSISRQPEPATG